MQKSISAQTKVKLNIAQLALAKLAQAEHKRSQVQSHRKYYFCWIFLLFPTYFIANIANFL